MILPDSRIKALGPQMIEPFSEEQVEPASYDCQLGNTFKVCSEAKTVAVDLGQSSSYENLMSSVTIPDNSPFVLHPGEFVLGATKEYVRIPDSLVARVEGKSSLGRLGLVIHATAGFIDPGFNGNITLEMTNWLRTPIILRPGRLICQLSFHLMETPAEKPYQGRYQGDKGANASRYGK